MLKLLLLTYMALILSFSTYYLFIDASVFEMIRSLVFTSIVIFINYYLIYTLVMKNKKQSKTAELTSIASLYKFDNRSIGRVRYIENKIEFLSYTGNSLLVNIKDITEIQLLKVLFIPIGLTITTVDFRFHIILNNENEWFTKINSELQSLQ